MSSSDAVTRPQTATAPTPRHPATMTIDEWCETMGVGRHTGYLLARRGEIPGLIRLGRRLVVSRAVVDRVLAGEH